MAKHFKVKHPSMPGGPRTMLAEELFEPEPTGVDAWDSAALAHRCMGRLLAVLHERGILTVDECLDVAGIEGYSVTEVP